MVLDIRNHASFKSSHIPGSHNFDIGSDSQPNPYKDPATLVMLFDTLNTRFAQTDPEYGPGLEDRFVIVLSRDGNVARLATSILRNRGVSAHYVVGGIDGWVASGLWGSVPRAHL